MPYGYLGTQPNQTVKNTGVLSVTDVAELESQGKLGGSLELIEEQTVSGVSSVNFTDMKENIYEVHFVNIINNNPSVDSNLAMRFSNDSGSTYEATNYQWAIQFGFSTGTFDERKSSTHGTTVISRVCSGGSSTNEVGNAYIYLYNLGNSSKYSFSNSQSSMIDGTGNFIFYFGGGVRTVAETVNAITLFNESGTGTISGTYKLYGVKQI